MSDLLPFIVIGIVSGSVYGLTATGLVLTYKTSGIFNFAQGSIAALAAFAFYFLHVDHNWSWPLTMAVCLLVVGPGMGLALERLGPGARRRERHPQDRLHHRDHPDRAQPRGDLVPVDAGVPRLPANRDVPLLRGERRLGRDDDLHHLARSGRRALLLLPVRSHGHGDAGSRRRPEPDLHDRREPGAGATLGLDHRHDVRRAVGRPSRAEHQPRRDGPHAPGRPGLRSGGDRVLLEPAADLRRWPDHRHPGGRVDQIRDHSSRHWPVCRPPCRSSSCSSP